MTRWLYSTNAKDIGTLYLIFSAFSGMLGLAFSVIIRMELSAPGVQYLQGNHQLFNVVITAHALLISTPFHFIASSDVALLETTLRLVGILFIL